MGKPGRKWKESVSMNTVLEAINTYPIDDILRAGKLVCQTDYAIRFFHNKAHTKFYKNEDAVRSALRRAVTVGAFEHRSQVIKELGLDFQDEKNE